MSEQQKMTPLELANEARTVLNDKHGEDITLLDVRGMSGVTDFYLMVSGGSTPHLKAMYNDLQVVLKKRGIHCYRKSGIPECGWLILDYVDVVIHIFAKEARSYYALEDLWQDAPRLD